MKHVIEIAVTDFVTAQAAVKGGADRIELCSAITEGGITPSSGMIRQCVETFSVPVFPIIRPRSGDFLYSEEEFEIILADTLLCKAFNCGGIATGFLERDGGIDRKRLGQIVNLAYPMEVTFHRAFDRCMDPFASLEIIMDAGCKRILTSGRQLQAFDGADLIKELIKAADGDIIIMPGSGIKPDNIKAIAERTGATEFHGALRNSKASDMLYHNPSFNMAGEYTNAWIDPLEVTAMHQSLNELTPVSY